MSAGRPMDAEGVWKDLKECMLSEAISECSETKGISRHKETWWWNDEVATLVQERSAYLDCGRVRESVSARKDAGARKGVSVELASVGKKTSVFGHLQDVNADLESMKENYNRAKLAAKLASSNAKNAERLKFCEELEDED